MKYGSVCSGIEAATQAWEPLGWTPAFFSEIEKFPSAVLAHHYGSNMPGEPHSTNGVPNYGDMTNFKEWPDHGQNGQNAIDILVGGTPCQTFSVAGLRQGLNDPRGNLMLTFGAMAKKYQPKWIVWENVPGVLSSNKGKDFGAFLQLLGECGYGFAYRVLDAQYTRVDGFGRAVPQRRRRVFVVGCLGDWRSAAAVLFEPESLSGNSAPRRKKGEEVAGTLGARTWRSIGVQDAESGHLLPEVCKSMPRRNKEEEVDGYSEVSFAQYVKRQTAGTLRAKGGALGGGSETFITYANPVSPAIATGAPFSRTGNERVECEAMVVSGECYAFGAQNSASQGDSVSKDIFPTLDKSKTPGVLSNSTVRRIMPLECERLQGFPDGFTQIPWRNKTAEQCPDGPRYKALGNSMAVNCMRWIGRRIEMIEGLKT